MKKKNTIRDERLDDMRDVLNTEQGRRVIWAIMSDAGLMSRIPAVENGHTQRMLGKREMALDVHDWVMEAAPEALLQMINSVAQDIENRKKKKDD
jgi:hypothetical protein